MLVADKELQVLLKISTNDFFGFFESKPGSFFRLLFFVLLNFSDIYLSNYVFDLIKSKHTLWIGDPF